MFRKRGTLKQSSAPCLLRASAHTPPKLAHLFQAPTKNQLQKALDRKAFFPYFNTIKTINDMNFTIDSETHSVIISNLKQSLCSLQTSLHQAQLLKLKHAAASWQKDIDKLKNAIKMLEKFEDRCMEAEDRCMEAEDRWLDSCYESRTEMDY